MNYHTLTFYSPLDEVWVSFTPSLKGCMCHADSREASKSLIHEGPSINLLDGLSLIIELRIVVNGTTNIRMSKIKGLQGDVRI